MELRPRTPSPIFELCSLLYEFLVYSAHSAIRALPQQSAAHPEDCPHSRVLRHAEVCSDEALGVSLCCCTRWHSLESIADPKLGSFSPARSPMRLLFHLPLPVSSF